MSDGTTASSPAVSVSGEASPRAFGAAIQGRRSEQQDSFRSVWLATEKAWLLVVADGMGGHAAGGVASRLGADTFVTAFTTIRSGGASLAQALQGALDEANARIASGQQYDPETEGMGTTLVAAHLSSAGLAWISVGDSPLWILRAGGAIRLNEDHSFRPAVAQGARAIANMLQSVLNGLPIALIDLQPKPRRLRMGDLVVLASDGVLTLNENEIAAAASRHADEGPAAVTQALLAEVESRQKSNQDNCAIIVAAPLPADDAASSGLRPAVIATVLAALAVLLVLIIWRLS